jgi:hypothetical protein
MDESPHLELSLEAECIYHWSPNVPRARETIPIEEIPFPALLFATCATAGTAQSPAAGFRVDVEPPLKYCENYAVETCCKLGAALLFWKNI